MGYKRYNSSYSAILRYKRKHGGLSDQQYHAGMTVVALVMLFLAIPVIAIIAPALAFLWPIMTYSPFFFGCGLLLVGGIVIFVLCLLACCVK